MNAIDQMTTKKKKKQTRRRKAQGEDKKGGRIPESRTNGSEGSGGELTRSDWSDREVFKQVLVLISYYYAFPRHMYRLLFGYRTLQRIRVFGSWGANHGESNGSAEYRYLDRHHNQPRIESTEYTDNPRVAIRLCQA